MAASPENLFRALADAPLLDRGLDDYLPHRANTDLILPAFDVWTPDLPALAEQIFPRYFWKAQRGHEYTPPFRALVAGDFTALTTRLGDNSMAALRDDLAHALALPRRLPHEWPALLSAAEWETRKHLIAVLPEIEKARAFWKLNAIIHRWPRSRVVTEYLEELAERFNEPRAREFGETVRPLDLLAEMDFQIPPRRLEKSFLLRRERKTTTIRDREQKFAAIAARFSGIPPP